MPLPNATPSTAAQSRVQHYAAKALVMLALLALGGVVWKVREVFHARQAQERHYAESELHIINQWQAESVAKWRNQRLADAMALSEDALLAKAVLDLPNSSVQAEIERLKNGARADLKQRGVKDADKAEIPDDIFRPQAERRVRLGLVVSDLVRANELYAKPEQLKAHIDELAASYEKPEDVVRWYFGDRQRLGEVEAVVIENNVADFVLSKAKVTEKALSFDELMGQG